MAKESGMYSQTYRASIFICFPLAYTLLHHRQQHLYLSCLEMSSADSDQWSH